LTGDFFSSTTQCGLFCQTLFLLAPAKLSGRLHTFLFGLTTRVLLGFHTRVLFDQALCLFFSFVACSFDNCTLARYFFGGATEGFFFRPQTLLLFASISFRRQTHRLLLGKPAMFCFRSLAGLCL
jgi:hypothetical protein